jgi:hypothetical protein
MKTLLIFVIAVVIAAAAGFGTGWHAKGVSVAAGQTKTATAQTKAVIADVQKQDVAQHADALAQQAKTFDLNNQQDGIRTYGMSLQQEIDHAVFLPYAVPGKPVMVTCPDPDATAEFVRLYNAAAAGQPSPAAAATTGGVHAGSVPAVPAGPDAATRE